MRTQVILQYVVNHLWMLIVISVISIVLYQMGIFNVYFIVPNTHEGLNDFSVVDWVATDNESDAFVVKLSPLRPIRILSVTGEYDGKTFTCKTSSTEMRDVYKVYNITCASPQDVWSVNSPYDFKLVIRYENLNSGLTHTTEGEFHGRVENVKVYLPFDYVPPRAELLFPTEQNYIELNYIKVEAEDNHQVDRVVAEIDGKTNYTLSKEGTRYYWTRINITSPGEHTIKIYAYDNFGNVNIISSTFTLRSKWEYFGWAYRKPIILDSLKDVNNFQVKLNITYESGMKEDFSDIRFATENGTKLPYWIENVENSSYAVVWVKLPEINGAAQVYLYYGNPNAEDESNGSAVFDMFNDFETHTLEGWSGEWEISSNAYHGLYGAESKPVVYNSEKKCMYKSVNLSNNSTLAFYWSVDGRYDEYLALYIDDVLNSKIVSHVNWRKFSTELTKGVHTLKFCYEADANANVGEADKGWVDEILIYKSVNYTQKNSVTENVCDVPTYIESIYPKNTTYSKVTKISVNVAGCNHISSVIAEVDSSHNVTLQRESQTKYSADVNITEPGNHTITIYAIENSGKVFKKLVSKFTISGNWAYPEWSEEKTIKIENRGNAVYDFQVKLNITYESGMKEDFSDIRFATENGTKLPYWIENVENSSYAVVWVKLPEIDEGNNTIYLYYNNPNAVSESNGSAVFELFDDFNGDSIDNNLWVYREMSNGPGDGYYKVENSELKLYGPTQYQQGGLGLGFSSKKKFGYNYAIKAYIDTENNYNGRIADVGFVDEKVDYWPTCSSSNYVGYYGGSPSGSNGERSCHMINNNGSRAIVDIPCFSTPVIMEIIRLNNETVLKINDQTYENTENIPQSADYVLMWVSGGWADQGKHSTLFIDKIMVYKYSNSIKVHYE